MGGHGRALELCRTQSPACARSRGGGGGGTPAHPPAPRPEEKTSIHLSPHTPPRGPLQGRPLTELHLYPPRSRSRVKRSRANSCAPAPPLLHNPASLHLGDQEPRLWSPRTASVSAVMATPFLSSGSKQPSGQGQGLPVFNWLSQHSQLSV